MRGCGDFWMLALAGCVACQAAQQEYSGSDGGHTGATSSTTASSAGAGNTTTGGEVGEPSTPTDPNDLPQDALFMCEGVAASSVSRLRRIERREWIRATGSSETGYKSSEVARTNPLHAPAGAPYSTWSAGAGIDPTTLDLYLGVLADSVAPWTGRDVRRTPRTYDDSGLRCMFEDSAPESECVDYYLGALLEDGVLYRPPTDEEFRRLRAFADGVLSDETDAGEREASLRRIASAAWLQSGALFRRELGEGDVDADGRRRLSDWELAQALALMISDRPPGAMGTYRYGEGPDGGSWTPADPMAGYLAEIEAAARDGSIQDPELITSLINTYAGGIDEERIDLNVDYSPDDRAARGEFWVSHKIQHFFREWLGYEGVELIFKDTPYATSMFADDPYTDADRSSIVSSWGNLHSGYYGAESLLSQQLDDVIARVIVEDKDVLRNLLTTRRFFVASTTAGGSTEKSTSNTHRPYNLTQDIGPTRQERWVELPEGERAGVLTHPAFLAAHGGNFEDDASAVHRGRVIREQLLCESVPGLELVMVEAKLVPSAAEKTARDRVVESVEGTAVCLGCHSLMNPLGYPFEIYNHAGFLRAQDHGKLPDGSSELMGMPDPNLDGPIVDAVDLALKLADSEYVKRCFIRHSFRYFMGRDESMLDACALAAMEEAYDDSEGSFFAMLGALATSDTFLYRHDEEEE